LLAVKNLKIVTTESFKELVLDSDSDVLVYVRLPSSPTPKDLQILARALGNDEDLVVAECKRFVVFRPFLLSDLTRQHSFLNELDPLYFGDTPAEGIKLFRKGHKSEPVTYHGKGNPFEIAFFLSLQRGYSLFLCPFVANSSGPSFSFVLYSVKMVRRPIAVFVVLTSLA